MYAVCADHVAMAIDEFIEKYATAPDLYELEQISLSDWEAPAHCAYCERKPKYLVV
ncbi:MAG TPA: CxxH/CxxC protein [Firmicutes bacterium]|nr:CxxH/CxxC protein [Bacillota bacterium]